MRKPSRAALALAVLAAPALSVVGVATTSAPASAVPPTSTVVDTVGTEFWTALPETLGQTGAVQTLYASPTGNGTITLSRTDGSVIATRALTAGQVEAFTIPSALQVTDADGVADQGIHIVATADISVYGVIYQSGASTGYQAFPVDALGTAYRALAYKGLGNTPDTASKLTVVATADHTTLTVTPAMTIGTRTAGAPYDVTLDEGQTYQLSGTAAAQDVTGTLVTSDHPVSVLAGTGCSNVPTGSYACNPLLQEMTPTSAWGKTFVSGRIATRLKGDTYRVLADHDDTVVSVGGVQQTTIDAGEFYEAVLPTGATTTALAGVLIETSKPSFVSQYGNGMSYDSSPGDPMMMSVPPAGQYLEQYVVAAPDVHASPAMAAYVNLVAPTSVVGQVLLDGTPVATSAFVAVPGSDFSVAQLPVAAAQHSISAPEPVGVNVYELGSYDGFGFTGGQAAESIALPPTTPTTPTPTPTPTPTEPVTPTPAAPTASPQTSKGEGTQSVALQVPKGGRATLLSGGVESNSVTVAEGTYLFDPTTNTISFVPRPGFTGTASPVTFRIRDAYDQYVDATYTAEVTAPVVVTPAPKPTPRASVALRQHALASPGRHASVPVGCAVKRAKVTSCTVVLTARVGGTRTVIGKATWKGAHGRVHLNAVGRALVANPGGATVRAQVTVRTSGGTLHAQKRSRVVSKRFTLVRTVRFAPESTRVGAVDRSWLAHVGQQSRSARSVTCTGYTDGQGPDAWNRALSRRRAVATCAALDLPKRVHVRVVGLGERHPVGDNGTSAGRAWNRRATVTFRY